jgi:heptose-I-phosphate ethanolaminephosphotransferase
MKMKNKLFFIPLILILDIPFIVFCFQNFSLIHLTALLISLFIPWLLQIFFNIKPWLFVLISFPVLYLSLSFDVLVFDYNSYYNISTWQAVFDTNPKESKEFLGILNTRTWITGILQILTFLFYLIVAFRIRLNPPSKKIRLFSGILLFLFSIDLIFGGITAKAYPFGHTLHSFIAYQKQSRLEKKLLPIKHSYHYKAFENQEFKNDTINRTIVVLITESLRRDHLGYYGYHRNTTPFTSKYKRIIYTDLISPANQTVNALRRVFSQAYEDKDSLYFAKPSIITAFNEAGYHTAWYSTQSVGKNGESKNSVIAKESDTVIFRNNNHLDNILLKDLETALQNKSSKKLIFLHFFGVHYLYNNRFPTEFTKFSKEQTENYKQDQINKYDDAVRYNDYLQAAILKLLKQQKGEKIFITFSDHGESLFESAPNIQGHGALQPAKVEFNVPFVLWFSDEYIQNHSDIYKNVLKNKDLPANNEDFFHSFPYLAGIEFKEKQTKRNFFNERYDRQKNRKVVNSALDLLLYKDLKD